MADAAPDDFRRQGEAHRDAATRRSRERTQAAADIGPVPPVTDKARRESCRLDLLRFLVTYFPHSTGLNEFSDDHRRVISRIQSCLLEGGRFVNAVYRGFAKTTIAENSAIWATSYGHRKFLAVFGAGREQAGDLIDSIKLELETNDLLLEDFPEVCFPVRALEGKVQRCATQASDGERTHIEWQSDRIVLPTIPGSAASGAVICCRSVMNARGLGRKRPDGTRQRPDAVILDDPQTDESAASVLQTGKRLNTIRKSILKLAGHQNSMAVVMNATVIEPDDLVDQLLDHRRNPAWQGERIPMVRQWAKKHEELWLGRYAELRNTYDPNQPGDQERAHAAAGEFYRSHRAEMDAGCVVSWVHCFDPNHEISAIQHAYNALIDDGVDVFASEFQQQPVKPAAEQARLLPLDEIAAKVNGRPPREVPGSCPHLAAMIDVQERLLWYAVVAWQPDFSGFVVGYGSWPKQKKRHFTLKTIRRTLQDEKPGAGLEGAIYHGLERLTAELAEKEWPVEGGGSARIGRVMIDANWGTSTDVVYQFCRQSAFSALLLPSHGKGVGPADKPLNEYRRDKGDQVGHQWRIPASRGRRPVRHCLYDANAWKTFVHARLQVPMGDAGCLSLYQDDPAGHAMLAEQLTAEYPVETTGRDRTVEVWKCRPGRDNHLLDCLVGCAVAGSILGAALPELSRKRPAKPKAAPSRKKVSYL